ncbi:prepilin peptidase [Gordonia humi]|uniref:Flp pilus assembly protein protease CpaA n=1 Tax=Gordonia humi TaxID=686429 RepID=A0A840F3K6_9ACTN|nr:A24 family peptidase [Gordonia humi]MBB4136496.1 Flp pilus assembly protein protease CpaA [Gordonia humi]
MVVLTIGLLAVAFACAVVDARTGRIPNALTMPAIGVVAIVAMFQPAVGASAALCAAVYAVAFVCGACGGGDVKLAAVVGGAVGNPAAILLVVVGAAVLSLIAAAARRRRTTVHGPAMVGAAAAVLAAAMI